MPALALTPGRPADCTGRLEIEVRVYDLLDALHILYERVDHPAAFTMEACAEIDRALAPAVICKNLLLCNARQSNFYLLMLRGDKRFHTRLVSDAVGSSRLSFAPPEAMQQYLDITPGSLSVLGLMNDRENHVQLLIDHDILHEDAFGCHPCVNTSSLRLSMQDLLHVFLPAVRHAYQPISLPAEEANP